MKKIVTDVNGDQYLREWKPGPKPKGYVQISLNVPPEYLAVMKWRNDECGGLNSVNEQIRMAIRGHLCGLVYASLLKS